MSEGLKKNVLDLTSLDEFIKALIVEGRMNSCGQIRLNIFNGRIQSMEIKSKMRIEKEQAGELAGH